MDIDSYYLIGHLFLLLAGAESMPSVSLVRVTSYRQCDDAQLFAQHACSGSDKQTASTYPLPTRSRCSEPQRILTLVDFHGLSRAEGPKGQTRSNSAPSCFPVTRDSESRQPSRHHYHRWSRSDVTDVRSSYVLKGS